MKQIDFTSPILKERYCLITHPSGLSVYVFPKQLTGTYALLATGFGSVNTQFTVDGREYHVPDGIAHFLEHKLFENEDGSDSFTRFSELGADANAYTTYNKTAYLFSCTERFDEALEELLRFVMNPYFTQATVKKEIGIIYEEIRMTEDNPWDRGFELLLQAMYQKHPVRNNICGTQASIRKITAQSLYDCHRYFYDPSQMSLVVCGDVTAEQVIAVVDRMIPQKRTAAEVVSVMPNEPHTVEKPRIETRMQVSKPIFFMGFKDICESDPQKRLRRDATFTLLDEILFSRSGEFYNSLFERDLLTPSFTAGYSSAESFALNCVSGESDNPEAVVGEIGRYMARVFEEGIKDADIERCKRVLYADEIRAYDSTEEIANRLLSFVLDGAEIFSYPELIESITKEELTLALGALLADACHSVSVIYPLEDGKINQIQ